MSITRDSMHKRRPTSGTRVAFRKKRKFELGRQPAMTRIGEKSVHLVRCRFGIVKRRALRLDSGNFSWPTQGIAFRSRIINVVYNASNNELVRQNTLVRNSIIEIDANPFRAWYLKHYGVELGKIPTKVGKLSADVLAKQARRRRTYQIEKALADQFLIGKLYACISSRPGQTGRADGYILEGKELEFYLRKMDKKKKKN